MTSPVSLFARAAELEAAGRSFAGRHGRGGPAADLGPTRRPRLVHPDGSIEGWVGGSCAQPARRPRGAPGDRRWPAPAAPAVSKERPAEGRARRRRRRLVMTCHSGGTLEIYVEPHLPAPAPLDRRHDARSPARWPSWARRSGWRRDRHRPDRRSRPPSPMPTGSSPADDFAVLDPRRPSALRRRRQPGHLGRGGGPAAPCAASRPTSASWPRRRGPAVVARWLLRGDDARRPSGSPRLRAPAGLDLGAEIGRGGRRLDPRRARPGPPRAGRVRRLARTGDAGRRRPPSRIRSCPPRPSTTSSCSIRSAG